MLKLVTSEPAHGDFNNRETTDAGTQTFQVSESEEALQSFIFDTFGGEMSVSYQPSMLRLNETGQVEAGIELLKRSS